MAVVYQSHTAASIGTSVSNRVVTHPSGLTAGDLMVAFIATLDNGADIDVITGWTDSGVGQLSGSSSGTTMRTRVLYKVATSTDVSNGNTTFTFDETSDFAGASIHRINGQNPNPPIDGASGDFRIDTASPSHSTGLTPTHASEVLLFCVAWAGGTGISAQAISTNNPSWTEDYDTVSTLGMSMAHATRTETTGLGDMSCTIDGGTGSSDSMLIMVVIKDLLNVTVSADVVTSNGVVNAPTIAGGATVSIGAPVTSIAVANNAEAEEQPWRRQAKPAASWTRQSKP